MAVMFAFGVWHLLGVFVHRAHKQSGSEAERRRSGDEKVAAGVGSTDTEIPNTVPTDWVETYRAEHGG